MPPGIPACGGDPACVTDINNDCVVDNIELQAVLDDWAAELGEPDFIPAVNYVLDRVIDNLDLQALLDTWANNCSP
jgi:hypothetical protein